MEKFEKDKFIQIAAGGKKTDGEIKRLKEIEPIQISHRLLTETDNSVTYPPEKTEEQLFSEFCKEKANLKKHYKPFLRFYPDKAAEEKTQLINFYYRKETENDKRDFSLVLSGSGKWEKIKTPHYEGPAGKWNCFYRTCLDIELLPEKRYVLQFQAVDYIAEIYINGRMIKIHEGFFAPFEVDITDYAVKGKNSLLVVVKNKLTTTGVGVGGFTHYGDKIYAATNIGYDEPYEGWHHCPPGAGIFGKVFLSVSNYQRITDIFIEPDYDNSRIIVNTTVFNSLYGVADVDVYYTLEGRNFKETVFADVQGKCDKLQYETNYLKEIFAVTNFKPWTSNEPYLYEITVKIKDKKGNLLDCKQTHFGMRKFVMDEGSVPKGKFYFNNDRIILRGTNEMGHLPRAVMENDYERLIDDILTAKVAGLNFYRMTQRPVFHEIYDYFDMLGMFCQTDFPLFSYLKHSALGNALKQVDEMELITRSHPSVVIESLCNETLDKTAWGKEQYVLSRYEIESFFNAARHIIKIDNPQRVIKYCEGDYAPIDGDYGISDFHCYTFWYISHALPSGKMRKGYLPPIKQDWMSSCGEFGADGLDRFELLKKYCPKEWLPDNEKEKWSPVKIAKEQCYVLHGDFFKECDCAESWIKSSRLWQKKAIKEYVDILRFRIDYVQSTAVHLLIDAWPCGWTKALIDADRIPKPAFYEFKTANTTVRGYLRRDKYVVYNTDKPVIEAYCFNDSAKDCYVNGCVSVYYNGVDVKNYNIKATIAKATSTTYLGDVSLEFPEDFQGSVRVVMKLSGDRAESYEKIDLKVKLPLVKANKMPMVFTDKLKGIKNICEYVIDEKVIFVDSDYYIDHQKKLESRIIDGSKVFVFIDKPLNVFGENIVFKMNTLEEEVAANNFVEVNKNTEYTSEFDDYDFMNFYNEEKDYQDLTAWFKFDWQNSRELLYTYEFTGEEEYNLHKKHKNVLAEKFFGKGKLFLSTLSCLNGCVGNNPALDKLLINIIEK